MVYVMLADGFEEIEALAPVDLLRRADIDVRLVGVSSSIVSSSRGIKVVTDCTPSEVDLHKAEMIFLPGGPGTQVLYGSEFVRNAVRFCVENDRYLAAICAAPSVILGGMGLLRDKKATCFPGMEEGMSGAQAQDMPCCIDGKIITGRSAGAALDFALALCAALRGEAVAEAIRRKIYYDKR